MPTSPRIEKARALVRRIRDALDDAELGKVMATIDARDVESGARHGIVVVSPPKLTAPTFRYVELEWELHVIAGPATDYLAAWARIDTIIQALIDADVELTDAEPGQFQPHRGEPLWAYTATLTESD
jgi:hypothetical protein